MVFVSYLIDPQYLNINKWQFVKHAQKYLYDNFGRKYNDMDINFEISRQADAMLEFVNNALQPFGDKPYIKMGGVHYDNCVAIRKLTSLSQDKIDELDKHMNDFIKANFKDGVTLKEYIKHSNDIHCCPSYKICRSR